jgi:uncharacterized protein (TIGR02145 family)
MKLNNILLIVILFFSQCIKERLNPYDNLGTGPGLCTFVYSKWSVCTNNNQTRTYTSSPFGCVGTPPADSIKRNCVILSTVKIGTQNWTSKNLDVSTYRNGDVIPQVLSASDWANLSTGAWCYYANNTANGTIYGKLYNWYAIKDSRGLAPNGYHFPTNNEWFLLTDYLGAGYGGKMKEVGTSHWNAPNTGATNSSGFNGLPGGFRSNDGSFSKIGEEGNWWHSAEGTGGCKSFILYSFSDSHFYIQGGYWDYGLSVRLIED